MTEHPKFAAARAARDREMGGPWPDSYTEWERENCRSHHHHREEVMTYEHTIPEGALLAYTDQPVRSPISGNVSHWLIIHTAVDGESTEVVGGFEINREASTPGNLAYYAAVFVDGIPQVLARTCSARYLARRMVIEAHRGRAT